MNWRTAFFKQAENDYAMFREFKRRTDIALCQRLHYLQMATEKLAKAYLSPVTTGDPPPRKHHALVGFLRQSKRLPHIREKLGYDAGNYHAYCAYIDSLLDIAGRVEALAPSGDGEHVNPEYPWSDSATGEVRCPAEYTFSELRWQDINEFQKLTDALFRIF